MKTHLYCLFAALAVATTAWGQPPADAEDGVEVLTRGPIHEAFAETVTFDPEPGVVVKKPAPQPIDELPPDQKPEGDNVDWIPGYWAWDDDRSDYLWVSGLWRSLPPGRQWVSGYWAESDKGSQWTSGYWADAKASEIEYVPEPPETVEAGPSVEAPSNDHTWLPGCWVYQQNRYAWRPGYWSAGQANWVWIPAHYVWTPRGYVFVDGYYDHAVARRGVLFAPVYFDARVYSRRGYAYSPATVINPTVFLTHLFLRPSYGHYYFGDYYGSNYARHGYSPWFSYNSDRRGYDSFYAHQHWHHRNDRQWHRQLESDFAHRNDHEEARPPRNWMAQQERAKQNDAGDDKSLMVAASLDAVVKSKDSPIRFQQVAKEDRQAYSQRAKQVHAAREQRQKLELAVDATEDSPDRAKKAVKVKLPKSAIVAKEREGTSQDDAPPKIEKAPEPDSKVEAKVRKPRQNVVAAEPMTDEPDSSPERPKGEKKEPKLDSPKPKPDSKKPMVDRKDPAIEPKKPMAEPKKPRAEPKSPMNDPKPKVEPKKPNAEVKKPNVEVKKPSAEPRTKPPQAKPQNDGPNPRVKKDSKGEGKNKPGN